MNTPTTAGAPPERITKDRQLMEKWRFIIRQYADCPRIFADYGNSDNTIGGGTAFLRKDDAVKWLREQQRKRHIPDGAIEWEGLEFEQMELFGV